jgi:TM2 domain-containing membrane protein YozV/predicted Ser/Thr protein kinase
METERICPNCRKPLPPDVPLGLCPECLIKSGFPTEREPGTGGIGRFVPPPVEEISRLFPQFEILGFIGKGGMGAVYQARQLALDRLVALKVLPPAVASDPGFAERFTREARALARLSHPNIVGVYDFGKAGPLHYLVMEFVDGTNLREVERAGRLSPEQALAIVPQICEALQFAHNEGIVHRDIKPENLLLDKKGRLKITDFGIVKLLDVPAGKAALTGAKDVVGTPHYMAPEQIEKPQTVDHRADIYSLGVVFYEMLTGELPLGKFAPPSKKVQVDVRLDEVVLHTLEKEPSRRYQKASQVKTDVETIASTPPPAVAAAMAKPPVSHGPPPEPVSERILLPTFLLAFFVGIFGAHRFYVGKIGTGVLQLLTLGGLGIWTTIDWILILCKVFTDGNGRRITEWWHPVGAPPTRGQSAKLLLPTFLLAIFFGVFGAHRFYVGKIGTGILQLLTLGGLGVWAVVDWILILCKDFTDKDGRIITNWWHASEAPPKPPNPRHPPSPPIITGNVFGNTFGGGSPMIVAPALALMISGFFKLIGALVVFLLSTPWPHTSAGQFVFSRVGIISPFHEGPLLGVGIVLFTLVPALVMIYGAAEMMRCGNYVWAIAGSVAGILFCSTFGLPAGIWALIVLLLPDVQNRFANPPIPLDTEKWLRIFGSSAAVGLMLLLLTSLIGYLQAPRNAEVSKPPPEVAAAIQSPMQPGQPSQPTTGFQPSTNPFVALASPPASSSVAQNQAQPPSMAPAVKAVLTTPARPDVPALAAAPAAALPAAAPEMPMAPVMTMPSATVKGNGLAAPAPPFRSTPVGEKRQMLQVQLHEAQMDLTNMEARYSIGTATSEEVASARDNVEILKAEIAGNAVQVATIKVAAAQRELDLKTQLRNVGRASAGEIAKAQANLLIAKTQLDMAQSPQPPHSATLPAVPHRSPPVSSAPLFWGENRNLHSELNQAQAQLTNAKALYKEGKASSEDVDSANESADILQAWLAGQVTQAVQIAKDRLAEAQRERDSLEIGKASADEIAHANDAFAAAQLHMDAAEGALEQAKAASESAAVQSNFFEQSFSHTVSTFSVGERTSSYTPFIVGPTGKLTMNVDRGSVRVTVTGVNSITVRVTRTVTGANNTKAREILKDEHLVLKRNGNDVSITAQTPPELQHLSLFHRPNLDVHYEIALPRHFNVQVQTMGGDVNVSEVQGNADIKTLGGDLVCENIGGAVTAHTMGGDVRADGCKGRLDMQTMGGNVTIKGCTGAAVHATTSGGSVSAEFTTAPTAESELETAGGNITVCLPGDAALTLDGQTFGGAEKSDFPVKIEDQFGNSTLSGAINGGGPILKMHTQGGNIELLKR